MDDKRSKKGPKGPRPSQPSIGFAMNAQQRKIYAYARGLTQTIGYQSQKMKAPHGFAIKGSTAYMMHGLNVVPGDLDVVTEHIPVARNAVSMLGYKNIPSLGQIRVEKTDKMPQIDILHGEDWGEPKVKDTRLMYGVRVKSREALMKDLKNDKRPEKQTRNQVLYQAFEEQIEKEKGMQMVLYTGPK